MHKQILWSVALVLAFAGNITSAQDFRAYEASSDKTLVETEAGTLMGGYADGIYNFRGVRYAQAERFMMPQPVDHWEGIRTAVKFGENCLIPSSDGVANDELFNPHRYMPMNEDCQFLNIWTPEISDDGERPVMVWIHGGGFTNGSGIEMVGFDGHNLSKSGDVVVITLNHRINALGFLNLGAYGDKYKYSANVGLADLVAALEWIQANIEHFGGDPENVTIMGQSGGGRKVRALTAMESADGLFHKAIVQSGASVTDTTGNSAGIIEATLDVLGLDESEVGQLEEIPYLDLLSALRQAEEQTGFDLTWGPSIDNVLVTHPTGNVWSERAKDIPLLIGSNLTERPTVIRNSPESLLVDNKNDWSDQYARQKLQSRFGDNARAVEREFLKAYPNKSLADAYFIDDHYRPGTADAVLAKVRQDGAPVYSYVFTRFSPVMDGIAMAWHCAEIPYVFNNAELVSTSTGGGPEAAAMAYKMSSAWVNFARYGDPNHDGLPKWPAYSADVGATMIFDNVSEVRYHHDRDLLPLITN